MISVAGVNEPLAIFGLSSDEKPTKANGSDKVPNGCIFICIDDTSKAWIYDRENDRWCAVK